MIFFYPFFTFYFFLSKHLFISRHLDYFFFESSFIYLNDEDTLEKDNIRPVIADLDDDGKEIPNSKKVIIYPRPNRKNKNVSVRDIQVLSIRYTVLEKIDPNFKG